MLCKQARQRVPTGQLNRLIQQAQADHPPPLWQGRQPRILYATQVGIQPPTIVLVCNEPRMISQGYRRYLVNVCRDHLPFAEIPIKLYLRKRSASDPTEDTEGPADD
jgi:GTP-binding protein